MATYMERFHFIKRLDTELMVPLPLLTESMLGTVSVQMC